MSDRKKSTRKARTKPLVFTLAVSNAALLLDEPLDSDQAFATEWWPVLRPVA